jgi:hypothetical protein
MITALRVSTITRLGNLPLAMARMLRPAAMPREISSRSTKLRTLEGWRLYCWCDTSGDLEHTANCRTPTTQSSSYIKNGTLRPCTCAKAQRTRTQ